MRSTKATRICRLDDFFPRARGKTQLRRLESLIPSIRFLYRLGRIAGLPGMDGAGSNDTLTFINTRIPVAR
jgi:hypothetical protein